jgi:alkylation response protein AidB-like acyl-CoA dehydrogenase
MIGIDGFGFKYVMDALNGCRIEIATLFLEIASMAFELSLKNARERKLSM